MSLFRKKVRIDILTLLVYVSLSSVCYLLGYVAGKTSNNRVIAIFLSLQLCIIWVYMILNYFKKDEKEEDTGCDTIAQNV